MPLWLPKGAALRDRLEHFLRNVQKRYGYLQVITPHIGMKDLYVTSGHAKYGKDSFQPIHTPDEGEGILTSSNRARTRICRCASPSSAPFTATNRAASCTD